AEDGIRDATVTGVQTCALPIYEFCGLFLRHLTGPVAAVLVFEAGADWPGQWPLVVARKGRAEFRIDVEGRGAHAGSDFWSGRNEIGRAACREKGWSVAGGSSRK